MGRRRDLKLLNENVFIFCHELEEKSSCVTHMGAGDYVVAFDKLFPLSGDCSWDWKARAEYMKADITFTEMIISLALFNKLWFKCICFPDCRSPESKRL